MTALNEKLVALQNNLRELKIVAVAFSGGVDSTFLLKVAHDVLGNSALAVTAKSLSFPERELQAARDFCATRQIEHLIIESEELDIAEFADNPPHRCYLCKKELFTRIAGAVKSRGSNNEVAIVEASNIDDESDYRPGHQAIKELGVFSPLRYAKMTKPDIRELSKQMNLPTWNKQPFACLASRFPYGEKITAEKLRRLDVAENFLLSEIGLRVVRVRLHEQGKLARIETAVDEIAKIFSPEICEKINAKFAELGFLYTTLDLRGYRTGSMNATLPATSIQP